MDANLECTIPEADWKVDSSRWAQAQILQDAADYYFWWHSSRQVAGWLGVADSSFRYCLKQHQRRCEESQFPRRFVEFCDSPDGLEFLQRLLIALHLVFVLDHDSGLRSVGWFLELSGLDEFLPPSYGAQQDFAMQLETQLAEFGQQEDQRLAVGMPPRQITVCEDETFHPQICLVAIEPVSNFLLLEQYSPQRDAETWSQALGQRLVGWSVTVCPVTSDEAKALIAHAEQRLGAHHSPDLFHVQHDTVQATSLMLAGRTRGAHQTAAAARQLAEQRQQELTACQEQCPESSHVAELQQQADQAATEASHAQERLTACQSRQQQACEARQGISRDYHPVDMETGEALIADEVQGRLEAHFDCLEQIADEVELSPRAKEKLAKARRVLPAMVGTIAFFWATVAQRLAGWQLSAATAAWLREQLIPGFYLQVSAAKGSMAAERFFGQRPQPLLPWLLSRLPLPARPRQRRPVA